MSKPKTQHQHRNPPDGMTWDNWQAIRGFRGGLTDALQLLMCQRDANGEPLACREHLHKIRVATGMPMAIVMAANSLYTASCSAVKYAVVMERNPETGQREPVRKPIGYDLTPLRAAQEIADRCEGKAVQRVHVKTEAIRNPGEVQAELVALLAAHPELASLVGGGLRGLPPADHLHGGHCANSDQATQGELEVDRGGSPPTDAEISISIPSVVPAESVEPISAESGVRSKRDAGGPLESVSLPLGGRVSSSLGRVRAGMKGDDLAF